MNTRWIVVVCFVLAEIVSAGIYPPTGGSRISWLPVLPGDIDSYARREINYLSIDVVLTNGNKTTYWGLRETLREKGTVWNLEEEIGKALRSPIHPTLMPGQELYYIKIQLGIAYDKNGVNASEPNAEEWFLMTGSLVTCALLVSPPFVFPPRENGKLFLPEEACSLPIVWNGYISIPATGKSFKWVDYRIERSGQLVGLKRTDDGVVCNPQIYINCRSKMIFVTPVTVESAVFLADYIEGKATVVVWYDNSLTDGTEWDLRTGAKREIYPPKLSIIGRENGAMKITFAGLPANAYTLEGSPVANFGEIDFLMTVLSDSNGIATWSCDSSSPIKFFRARPAQVGETP